jgi:pyruvate/2-oxoglutarate dehydrogenase complex dihydrolipoamide acyltransferase (E2) component
MAFSVVMPALEMAQETGKLIAWRKQEGERVTKGEPLLEIETDKAVLEVEAPADGILAGITGLVGTDIPVGKTIAWIVALRAKSLPRKMNLQRRVRGARSAVSTSRIARTLAS